MDSQTFAVRTGSTEQVLDITRQCAEFVDGRGDGLLHVFVPHATAGIAILETGAGSDDDLLAALADLLPADDRWRHRHGSPGHGRSHVMPALVPPYATVPVHRRPARARHLAEHLPGRPQRRQPRPRGPAVVPGRLADGGDQVERALAEGVDEQGVVLAGLRGVVDPELDQLVDERLGVVVDRLDDRLLGLEVDEVLVAVLVGDAVDLGGRPARAAPRRARSPRAR